jgi:hypothetical protein
MKIIKTVTLSFDELNRITNVFVKQGGFEEDINIEIYDEELFWAQPLGKFIKSYCNIRTEAEDWQI